jgi:hypothetical protein
MSAPEVQETITTSPEKEKKTYDCIPPSNEERDEGLEDWATSAQRMYKGLKELDDAVMNGQRIRTGKTIQYLKENLATLERYFVSRGVL